MKRKTKSQRDAEQKAALLQRVTDIYSGALGQSWYGDYDNFANAELLSNVMPALEQIFGPQREYTWYWKCRALSHFDNPIAATEFLFMEGFRA
jgi:hypothetical protein